MGKLKVVRAVRQLRQVLTHAGGLSVLISADASMYQHDKHAVAPADHSAVYLPESLALVYMSSPLCEAARASCSAPHRSRWLM